MSAESTTSKKEIESQVNLLKKFVRAYGVAAGEGREDDIFEFTKENKGSEESILKENQSWQYNSCISDLAVTFQSIEIEITMERESVLPKFWRQHFHFSQREITMKSTSYCTASIKSIFVKY